MGSVILRFNQSRQRFGRRLRRARGWRSGANSLDDRRAIVCYVEDNRHLIQQVLALRRSWLDTCSPDTDLVIMGPDRILAKLPDDVVKIPQDPAADDPVWRNYRYVNSIVSLNAVGAEQLDKYSHILRTDVDTFVLPGWNDFTSGIPDRTRELS